MARWAEQGPNERGSADSGEPREGGGGIPPEKFRVSNREPAGTGPITRPKTLSQRASRRLETSQEQPRIPLGCGREPALPNWSVDPVRECSIRLRRRLGGHRRQAPAADVRIVVQATPQWTEGGPGHNGDRRQSDRFGATARCAQRTGPAVHDDLPPSNVSTRIRAPSRGGPTGLVRRTRRSVRGYPPR
jgi:hypothetical protein